MRAAISLLVLLFSMCGAQTRSTQTEVQTESQSAGADAAAVAATEFSRQVDIYVELKELRDMAMEQRDLLDSTQDEVKKMESENAVLQTELAAVKTKLVSTETQVENLQNQINAAPKVAFSAALKEEYTEAGAMDLNVIFPRVITNVGQAYSSVSGFFIAPVRGVYYFRFTAMDILQSHWMMIHMHKNGELVLGMAEYESDGQQSYLSSGVTLQLEVGDVVNMVLPAGYRLYDNFKKQTTFSGFLLFPL